MSAPTQDAPGTPLPWGADVNAGKPCIGVVKTCCNGATFVDIGEAMHIAFDESGEWCVGLTEQDARYIVTACNAYPELVAALEAVVASSPIEDSVLPMVLDALSKAKAGVL